MKQVTFIAVSGALSIFVPFVHAHPPTSSGYQEYPYSDPLQLKNDAPTFYANDIQKKDIYWFARSIKVDTPLYSNGGDILLIADDIEISAPIDSKVRLSASDAYWHPFGAVPYMNIDFPAGWPHVLDGLDDYYFWNEQYDPSQTLYTFTTQHGPPITTRQQHVQDNRTDLVQLAELPPGMIAHPLPFYNAAAYALGEDAPEVTGRDAIKAGKIVIITSQLHFCATCSTPFTPTRAQYGDPYDLTRRVMLNASGIKGGRGAVGPLGGDCNWPGTCGSIYQNGLSGAPSKAGDAGDVLIYFVGDAQPPAGDATLMSLTDVSGGKPAQLKRSRPGLFATFGQLSTLGAGRADPFMKDEGPDFDAPSLMGADGQLIIQHGTSTTDALMSAIRQITTRSFVNLDIPTMVEDFQETTLEEFVDISPRRQFRRYLSSLLADLEVALLQNVVSAPKPPGFNEHGQVQMSPILGSLSCTDTNSNTLTLGEIELLRQLCFFRDAGKEPLSNYFYFTGGLYKTIPSDINSRIYNLTSLHASSKINETLQELKQDLLTITDQLRQDAYRAQLSACAATLSSLRAQAAKLQAVLQANNGGNFGTLMADAIGFAAAIAGLDDNFIAISEPTPGAKAPSTSTVLKDVGSVFSTFDKLWGDFAPGGVGDAVAQLRAVKQEIENTESQIRVLTAEAATWHEQFAARMRKSLRDYVVAGATDQDLAESIRLSFEDMLRASVQAYVTPHALNLNELRSNLRAVQQNIYGFPQWDVSLNFPVLYNFCAGGDGVKEGAWWPKNTQCLFVSADPSKEKRVFSPAMLGTIPLQILEPNTGVIPISIGRLGLGHGISTDTVVPAPMNRFGRAAQ
jgi:hypothetical protein